MIVSANYVSHEMIDTNSGCPRPLRYQIFFSNYAILVLVNVSAFSFLKYRADPKAQEDILQSSPTYLFQCHFRLLQTVLCSVSPALDVE